MLPQLAVQTFKTELISTKQTIEVRPFLAKEQKVLLMALESKNAQDVTDAIMNILKSCVQTPGIDVQKLPSFDIQKLFIELRKHSIGEQIEVKVRHPQNDHPCKHSQKVVVDLTGVKVEVAEGHTNKIKITDNLGVVMRYPNASMVNKYGEEKNIKNTFSLIAECIESVYDSENVYDDFTLEQMIDWIGQLNNIQFQKLTAFFANQPTLVYNLKYKCDGCGETVEHKLEGLTDFFT